MAERQRRRGAGEGSVYRRADGRWCGAYVVGYKATGKPDKRYVYAATRAEAASKLVTAQADAARGTAVPPNRQTLTQFAARYERDVLGGLSRNTRSGVQVALVHHILPRFGSKRLQSLRPAEIQAWLATCTGAPSSVRMYRNVLCRILEQAVAWGDLPRNPARLTRAPRHEQVDKPFLEREQARQVLAALQGDRWEALAWLALTVGLRRGELLALQWGDVDWDAKRLAVQRNWTRSEVKVVKTPKGRRSVPLFDEVLDALRRRRTEWPSAPWIFTTSNGSLISPSLITGWWAQALRRAGIRRHVVFHSTRHSAGSYLLDIGMPLPQVSRLLGHSSVSITATVYSHALASGEERYVEKLGALLASEQGS